MSYFFKIAQQTPRTGSAKYYNLDNIWGKKLLIFGMKGEFSCFREGIRLLVKISHVFKVHFYEIFNKYVCQRCRSVITFVSLIHVSIAFNRCNSSPVSTLNFFSLPSWGKSPSPWKVTLSLLSILYGKYKIKTT